MILDGSFLYDGKQFLQLMALLLLKECKMIGPASLITSLIESTPLQLDRIRYCPDPKKSIPSHIRLGIVFIHCFASPSSKLAFQYLAEILARLDPSGAITIFMTDTNSFHPIFSNPIVSNRLGGWGETLWIKDGAIQSIADGKRDTDRFESNTIDLLMKAG